MTLRPRPFLALDHVRLLVSPSIYRYGYEILVTVMSPAAVALFIASIRDTTPSLA